MISCYTYRLFKPLADPLNQCVDATCFVYKCEHEEFVSTEPRYDVVSRNCDSPVPAEHGFGIN